MTGLRLVSVNIERSRHLDRVIPFLHAVRPDVLCVQELEEPDVSAFAEATGLTPLFCPFGLLSKNARHEHDNVVAGVGIFARDMEASSAHYYKGSADEARTTPSTRFKNIAVLSADCMHEGVMHRIVTTHFTWVDGGGVNEEQRTDLSNLVPVLDSLDEFVLCGDFNAPRGGEIFDVLAARYTDNIPPEYASSIDGSLHRAGPLPFMVDGLFSTPRYDVGNVRLQDGISDHMAIVARVHVR